MHRCDRAPLHRSISPPAVQGPVRARNWDRGRRTLHIRHAGTTASRLGTVWLVASDRPLALHHLRLQPLDAQAWLVTGPRGTTNAILALIGWPVTSTACA